MLRLNAQNVEIRPPRKKRGAAHQSSRVVNTSRTGINVCRSQRQLALALLQRVPSGPFCRPPPRLQCRRYPCPTGHGHFAFASTPGTDWACSRGTPSLSSTCTNVRESLRTESASLCRPFRKAFRARAKKALELIFKRENSFLKVCGISQLLRCKMRD